MNNLRERAERIPFQERTGIPMKPLSLPSYASIFGDTHFPPIDNQGAIGSCASQAIMRNQFTNAVSRVIHRNDETSAFCPRDDFDEAGGLGAAFGAA